MAEQMFPPLVSKNGLGGGSLSNSSAMFFQPELIEFAPELPDVFDLMSIGVSRLDIADMICRTSLDDVERLPAIHPSVMSSRGEQVTRYITFVSSPPIETRAPKDRPRLEKKKNILGPEDCFRCQLKTEHSACERHKFVRVGGGFRHSFSYIKQILDVIEDKSRQQAAETAKRLARVREEHEHKAFLRATQQKRKVKTYVRTKSGKLIKQYVFVTEKEYQEMKVDDVAARRILGLSTDEKLEDFTSTRKKYVVNEDGEYVEVHKIREDSAYQESLESVNRGQDGGKASRRHRHRRQRGKGGNYSDDDLSIESGVGGSVEGGKCRSRRRRRRHRRGRSSYSSSASEESYINADGKKHVKSRRRRHRSREGDRRRRRHRSYSTSGDSGSDDADEEGKSRRHRRHRDKHGRRRRKSYYLSDGSDEDGSRGGHRGHGKRRHRLHRRGRSYSDDSFSSDDSRRRQRRRRRRGRRQSGSQGSCSGDYSDGTEGSPRRRRRHHHRRYSDDSESYSDYSGNSDDSTTVSRRRRRHQKHRADGDQQDAGSGAQSKEGEHRRRHRNRQHRDGDTGSYSSEYSISSNDEKGVDREKRKHRRHRGGEAGSYSSVYSTSSNNEEGVENEERKHRRHRRSRCRDDSSDGSDNSNHADVSKKKRRGNRRRKKHSDGGSESYSSEEDEIGLHGDTKKRRQHRRHKRNEGGKYDYSSNSNSESSVDSKGKHKKRRKKHRRRGKRRQGSDESDKSYTSDDSTNSHRKGGRQRRRHKGCHRRRLIGDGGSSSLSSDSLSDTQLSGEDHSNRLHFASSKELRSRSYGSGVDDSYSSISSSDTSTTYNTSSSSAVSIASSVSSVNSSDISSIEGDYTEDELQRLKQEKKEKTKKQKQQAKQKTKENKRKETREEKRESKRTEREKVKEKKKKRKDEKKRERRRNKVKMSPVSSVSDVSSVNSDDISDVDSNLGEEDRRILIEEKKLKKKEAKKANKFDQKVEKKKEEWRSKKKEKEKRRRVIELQKELERMSSASSVESVNSDDLSSIDSNLSDGEKQRIKEKKKAERQLTKNIIKAKSRLKEKRKKEGKVSDHEDDVTIDEIGDEEIKAAIKKIKRGKKVKGGKGGIDGDDSDDRYGNYAYGNRTDKASKNKKENEKLLAKNDMLELRAPDGTKVRVSIPKSMRIGGKFVGKIRLKVDGTVAADDDEDAESVIIDEDGNLVSQPTMLINPKTIVLDNETWDGFQPTPPPPKTPTDGGRVQFTGIKRVLHAFRKNGEVLQKHLDVVLDTAGELNDYKQRGDKRAMFIDERGSSIDYISHFRLVEKRKLDPFGKAFVVEDDDFNCVINLNELKGAIEGIPTLQTIKPKQLEYALKVLNIDEHSVITFKMFAVMAALSERMCTMDSFSQHLIDISDLMDIQRKMELYKAMFYCNVNSERSDNHITAESLHIELRAGGLNRAQEQYIMSLMKPDEYSDISFIDYMAYIPLFLSMHENIIDNPLDMAEKYNQKTDSIQQRDMNPLGLPLRREFIDAATSTTERKVPSNSIRTFIDKGDLLRREASSTTSLPRIPSARKGSSQWSPASRLSQR